MEVTPRGRRRSEGTREARAVDRITGDCAVGVAQCCWTCGRGGVDQGKGQAPGAGGRASWSRTTGNPAVRLQPFK